MLWKHRRGLVHCNLVFHGSSDEKLMNSATCAKILENMSCMSEVTLFQILVSCDGDEDGLAKHFEVAELARKLGFWCRRDKDPASKFVNAV